jgi:D-alanine-D-alanine ligase
MLTPHRTFPFRGVVIIADLLPEDPELAIDRRRDLELTNPQTLQQLLDAILRLGLKVQHYEHPKILAEHAAKHMGDVILSIFGGAVSRSRMALVPAVCETFGLSFVGPDAYGRIICQDKEVSKTIALEAGLKVAPHRIVREKSDISRVLDFPLPYVAKPLWEGSSIGIGSKSLVTDRHQGEIVLQQLLEDFEQPIMVESFISGREVSWCFIDGLETDRVRAFAEMVWADEPDHFDRNLYDAQHKLISEGRKTVRNITDELRARDAEAMERLLQMVGPIGYGRIDGKLRNGEFVFLEITPDAWLGPTGTFVSSFSSYGMSFDEVIARVLLSARTNLPSQSPNDLNIPGDT